MTQPYICLSKFCNRPDKSIEEWRRHAKTHSFQEGYICLFDNNCTKFFSGPKSSFLCEMHLYLDHNVGVSNKKNSRENIIPQNYECPSKGRVFCHDCEKFYDFGNYDGVLDHFEGHIKEGKRVKLVAGLVINGS